MYVLITFGLLSTIAWIIAYKYDNAIWVGVSLVGALVSYFLGVVFVEMLQMTDTLPKSRLQKLYMGVKREKTLS